jgi:outer membrane protein TolC
MRPALLLVALVPPSLLHPGCSGKEPLLPEPRKPEGPLSLDAAVALALENNPDLLAAGERVAAARAAVDEAASQYWPVLRFIESFTQINQPSRAFGSILDQRDFDASVDFNDPGITPSWQTGLTGSITLYDGGRRRARVLAREAEAESAAAAAERTRHDIAYEVARSFYLLHKAREAAAAQERSISTLTAHVRIAEARVAEGAARRSEALAVGVRLAETREAAVVARSSAARAEAGLKILLGLRWNDPLVLESPGPFAPGPPEDSGALFGRAAARRPELLEAAAAARGAMARVKEATAGYLPEVTLLGSMGWDDNNPFDLRHVNWTWGVTFLESLINAFRAPIHVREALAALKAAAAAARSAQLRVELDVQNALLDAEEAAARQETASQAQALAEESLRLVEAEYQQGAANVTRLLDAELALTQARTRLSAATHDRALAAVAIAHAAGELPWLEEEKRRKESNDAAQP